MNNEVENEMAIQPECGLNKDKEDPSKNGHHPWCAGFFFHFFTPRSSLLPSQLRDRTVSITTHSQTNTTTSKCEP